jgi:hypothetical protein
VLDIIGEMVGIDQQSLEEYNKLFAQSSSLSAIHVQVMAALFGWATRTNWVPRQQRTDRPLSLEGRGH